MMMRADETGSGRRHGTIITSAPLTVSENLSNPFLLRHLPSRFLRKVSKLLTIALGADWAQRYKRHKSRCLQARRRWPVLCTLVDSTFSARF